MILTHWLLVAIGGAIGASLRYGLSLILPMQAAAGRFPWATFTANVLGCACAGLVYAWLQRSPEHREAWRLLLVVGVLGGFTTFSAFGLETWLLIRQGLLGLALINVLASCTLGVLSLAAMHRLAPGS